MVRFAETTIEGDRRHFRLLHRSGQVLLELRGHEVEDAIRAGFVDPDNLHFSAFEYARMRRELAPLAAGMDSPRFDSFDARFMGTLGLRWD